MSGDNRTTVKPGVDPDLDEKKRLLDGMGDFLSNVAQEIARDIPLGLPGQLNVIYFPQIGFLIAMPKDQETGTSLWEGSRDTPWERMFSTEKLVYYKNSHMQDLDEHFGDVDSQISGKC